jgi:hypothetical protein
VDTVSEKLAASIFSAEVYNMFNRNADIRVEDSRVYGSGRPYLKEMALIQ